MQVVAIKFVHGLHNIFEPRLANFELPSNVLLLQLLPCVLELLSMTPLEPPRCLSD